MADRRQMVTGVFRNRVDAEKAFDYLYANGYRDSEINVLMSDSTRSTFYPNAADKDKHSAGTLATEGMGVGGAIGTAVGATLAAVAVTAGTIVMPGIGTAAGLTIAGPIAAALAAGGGAGAVTGGLIGALVGAGMTEQNAEAYSEALKNGGVVIGVHPHSSDDANRIEKKFEELGGENVCTC
jgi:hypothetical protein